MKTNLGRILSQRAFLMINKQLLRLIGIKETILLSELITWREYLLREGKTEDGWFFHSHQQIELNTGMSYNSEQINAFKNLKEYGLVETKKKGLPARSYYLLNDELIEYLLQVDIQEDMLQELQVKKTKNKLLKKLITCYKETQQHYIYNKNKVNKIKNNTVPDFLENDSVMENKEKETTQPKSKSTTPKKPTIQERNQKYITAATMLAKIVQSKKQINITPSQIQSWANSLRMLEENNGVDLRRQVLALRWYRQHIGAPYVPAVESGDSFRSKFIKLENAIAREKQDNNPKHHRPSNGTGRGASKYKTVIKYKKGKKYDLSKDKLPNEK